MEQLIINKEDLNKTFAELFNINAELYSSILVCCLNINGTTLSELERVGIVYLSDLFLMTSKDLLVLRGVGNHRLNELLKLFYEIKNGSANLNAHIISYSRNIPLTIVINKYKIAQGDFSAVEINKKNDRIISKYKSAQETVGEEIAEICINSPNKILPVMSALSSFNKKHNIIKNKRKLLVELLSKVPDERKNKTINKYIQLYTADTYCKNTLNRIFRYNSVKLSFEEINSIISNDKEYKNVIGFLSWFILNPIFYLKNSIRKATLGAIKSRILNLRIEGYTYEEIATLIKSSENIVINKHNEIINLFFADNNSLAAMLLFSLDKGKKIFSENELEEEFGELTPKLIYLYSNSKKPRIYFDKFKRILAIK